jgi:putative membrane protein
VEAIMRSWTLATATSVLLAMTIGTAVAQSRTNSTSTLLSEKDREFLNHAVEDSQREVQLCLLAEKNAQDPASKAFARLMFDDHVGIEGRLTALAIGLGVRLPNEIGPKGQQARAKLAPLFGPGFDRRFVDAKIQERTNDINRFSQQAAQSGNEEIRRFASETLPILKQHLALAHAVRAQLQAPEAQKKSRRAR